MTGSYPFSIGDDVLVEFPENSPTYGDSIVGLSMAEDVDLLVVTRGFQPPQVVQIRIAAISYEFEEVLGVALGEPVGVVA